MTSVAQALGGKGQLASGLAAGVDTISENQTIIFTKYVRRILPLDGFVFWIRSDLAGYPAAVTTVIAGSLHYATTQNQNEDESFAVNAIVFTAEDPIQYLNDIAPDEMYLGEWQGLNFAFSQRQSYYEQAGLHHYVGDAVYPVMETQIINDVNQLLNRELVVSNSLPVWLTLNQIMPVYPSFLVPDNIRPPYASIHIGEDATEALQTTPYLDQNGSHWQLVSDRVRVTIYGLRNRQAMDYLDYILDFIRNHDDAMGLMKMSPMRDDKRGQNEISVLAMKKTIDFQVSYYQNVVRTIARQLITSCIPTYTIGDAPF